MIRIASVILLPIALLAGCATSTHPAPAAQDAPVAAHGLVGPVAPAPAPAPAPVPAPVPAAAPVAGTIHIFHGVNVVANTTHVDWSVASFGVSGGNMPTLSFFRTKQQALAALPPNAPGPQCWIDVSVAVADITTPVGIQGAIALPAVIPYANLGFTFANPGPWAVRFDDNPAGHWSIDKATFGGFTPGPPVNNQPRAFSNAAAGRIAAAAFREMAIPTPVANQPAVAPTVVVTGGTVANCTAQ